MKISSNAFKNCLKSVLIEPDKLDWIINHRITMYIYDCGFKVLTIFPEESKSGTRITFLIPVELIDFELHTKQE